jgi:hypothetical protein
LGKRTIFFCGIDKEAIGQAIKAKYQDIIQPDEYLEKIVDVSFSMPRTFDLRKFVALHFDEQHVDLITKFFTEIGFTNARKLKKVMNKYLLLRHIKENKLHGHELIPDQSAVLNIILTLFMIVMYEFYYEDYLEMKDLKKKEYAMQFKHITCERNIVANQKDRQSSVDYIDISNSIYFPSMTDSIAIILRNSNKSKIMCCNTFNYIPEKEEFSHTKDPKTYFSYFTSKEKITQTGFIDFIISHFDKFYHSISFEKNYAIQHLFDMVETLL